jgi:hypothetical protein
MSTEGAAQGDFSKCRALGAQLINHPIPGLTAGPIPCRSFGPQNAKANLDKPGLFSPDRFLFQQVIPFQFRLFRGLGPDFLILVAAMLCRAKLCISGIAFLVFVN